MRATIEVNHETNAGGGFRGKSELVLAYQAKRIYPDGRVEKGYLVKRKWLCDRVAFNYDPTMGWAYEFWFEWPEDLK